MVDEREDRYEGEEGEYHFSDDQINYDEVEVPKAAQPTGSMKKTIVDKLSGLSPSRRMLLAGVVFISLIGIVYKMLLPSSPALTGEIAQLTPATTPRQIVAAKPTIPPAAPPPSQAAPVIPQPPPVMNAIAAAAQQTPQIPQIPQMPLSVPEAGIIQPSVSVSPIQTVQQTVPSAPSVPSVPAAPPMPQQNVVDRVKAVEDHNAAMMNLLQTEYAQKISDFEMQSNLTRGKLDEMAKRINRIETSLNQITQLLQQNPPLASSKQQAVSMENGPGMPISRSTIPKVAYTVQAIIPGRAWLKADSGDTVTVAEGDTLRDYGRISKIDPYDGVVEIDTGNKIIALSYGMSAE